MRSVISSISSLALPFEPLDHGAYLVTDWAAGALYRVDSKGKASELIDLNQGSADLNYFPTKKTVLIPMMLDNTLAAYSLSAPHSKAKPASKPK